MTRMQPRSHTHRENKSNLRLIPTCRQISEWLLSNCSKRWLNENLGMPEFTEQILEAFAPKVCANMNNDVVLMAEDESFSVGINTFTWQMWIKRADMPGFEPDFPCTLSQFLNDRCQPQVKKGFKP